MPEASGTVTVTSGPDPQTELVLGLVGAVGVETERVVTVLTSLLRYYRYDTAPVQLSALLPKLTWAKKRDFPKARYDTRTRELMRAGTDLRRKWRRGDALGLMAIATLATIRRKKSPASEGGLPRSLDRVAFVLRSLKHPDEVEVLRGVYGSRFFLIGAYAPEQVRAENLARRIADDYGNEDPGSWSYQPRELMDRDESESDKRGQRLRDTFHRADMFIDARDEPRMRRDIERTLAIIFGDPFQTPTRDEHALFAAEGGSRRSAELGRQVGAAIATSEGSVVALGTNEVPAPAGGLYWEDDAVGREFHRKVDSNDEKQREIAEEIGRQLLQRGLIDATQAAKTEAMREAMLDTSLGDLTEFGRAVHAEMSALLDAASRGVPVKDCTLFSTTFPCHNCARHIIAAGIRRVVYVAPYAKSQAAELHADAIEVASASPTPGKVQFEPFVGVAPRRYLELFDAEWRGRSDRHIARKDKKTGAVQEFVKATANPIFVDVEPRDLRPVTAVYRFREAHAVKFMQEQGVKTGLGLPSDTSETLTGTPPRPNPSTKGNA